MKMKCIIVEGPQGCGKTTLANYLRENISASNLYRLTGTNDKTLTGKKKSKDMYYALLNYMSSLQDVGVNLIFDRTFFTDYVYSRLGYKEYDFSDVYEELLQKLINLDFDIYYINLYLKNVNLYVTRLKRKHHSYQDFSLQSSIAQQEEYKKVLEDLKKYDKIKTYDIAMDDFDDAYKKINKLFNIG